MRIIPHNNNNLKYKYRKEEKGNTHNQESSKDSTTLRAWMRRAVCLCSASRVEPNWLAAQIRDAHFSPRSRLISSCMFAKGEFSFPFRFPMSSKRNSPHFNLHPREREKKKKNHRQLEARSQTHADVFESINRSQINKKMFE